MMDIEKLRNSREHKRVLELVNSSLNKKNYELIKVNLYYHPYLLNHEQPEFILCNEIKQYGFTNIIMFQENDNKPKVKDLLDVKYIKSVEVFNPLNTENYKYVK